MEPGELPDVEATARERVKSIIQREFKINVDQQESAAKSAAALRSLYRSRIRLADETLGRAQARRQRLLDVSRAIECCIIHDGGMLAWAGANEVLDEDLQAATVSCGRSQDEIRRLQEIVDVLDVSHRAADDLDRQAPDDVENPHTCSICCDRPADTANVPCGHVFCGECLAADPPGDDRCYTCRARIRDRCRLFFS